MSDLISRLKEAGKWRDAEACFTAADEIIRLRAELEHVREERDSWRGGCDWRDAEIAGLRAELEKADDRWRQAVDRAELFCAERDRLAAKNVNLNILLKDICDEWNEGCDPACDSFGHTDTCKGTNIAQAKRAMRDEIERLRAELAECKRDAERYRWLRQAPGLKLESQFSRWTDEDGAPFTTTHRLAAYECQAGAYTTMDELIDSMIEMTDELLARYRKRYPADYTPSAPTATGKRSKEKTP